MAAIATDLQTLLPLIVAKFQTVPQLNQYRCFASVNGEIETYKELADSFLAVTPGEFDVDQRTLTGGGNDDLYMIGQFTAWLHLRLDLDSGSRSDIYLEDNNFGALAVIHNMIYAMNMFVVTDSSGNVLTPVPIRLVKFGPFKREKVDRSVGPLFWATCPIVWHLEYWQAVQLDLPDITGGTVFPGGNFLSGG